MDYQLKVPLLPLKDEYSVVERVFATRGIAPENIQHYLHTTDQDIISPELMMNVKSGAQLLIKHISQNDPMVVIVDCDADGYTSAATFINYLNALFPGYTQSKISYLLHDGKQHGLSDMMDKIPKECKLVCIPDAASNDYEYHKLLRSAGIDVLVMDHHEAEYVSEDAVIINNQLCDYPNKTLSGVGVVYKFCCYIDSILEESYADNFLDLVATGIISDMMSVKDFETKHLIEKGLANIRNPFLKEMIRVQNYSISRVGGLCPFAISFYITPQINGTIRMGSAAEKLMLFESMLDYKGYEQIPSTKRGCKGQYETRVEQACRNCTNIKRNQAKAVDASLNVIENIIENKNLTENKIIAVKLDKDHVINRNLTGLIANQLMAKYQHPILLMTEVNEENGIAWEGSGRGYDTSNFSDLRSFIKNSGYAFLAEGHANAFGVGIMDSEFSDFIQFSNKALEDCAFTPCTKVDFIWHSYDFSGQDVIDLASLDTVWGQELEKPYVAIENLTITPKNVILMSRDKNPTLKIELANGVSLIKFGSSEEEFAELTKNPSGSVSINVLGTCKINEWNGIVSPQIEIDDYEIVGEMKYYF